MRRNIQTMAIAALVVMLLGGALVWRSGFAQTQAPVPSPTAVSTGSPTAIASLTGAASPTVVASPTASPTPVISLTPPPAGDDDQTRTITVAGIGQASTTPDQVSVQIGVQTDAETPSEALSQNNEKMTALLNALTNAGVAREDIQTQNLILYPRYDQTLRV